MKNEERGTKNEVRKLK